MSWNAPHLSTTKQTYSYNETVRFVCSAGFFMQGNQERNCTKHGPLEPPFPNCTGIDIWTTFDNNCFMFWLSLNITLENNYSVLLNVRLNHLYGTGCIASSVGGTLTLGFIALVLIFVLQWVTPWMKAYKFELFLLFFFFLHNLWLVFRQYESALKYLWKWNWE